MGLCCWGGRTGTWSLFLLGVEHNGEKELQNVVIENDLVCSFTVACLWIS